MFKKILKEDKGDNSGKYWEFQYRLTLVHLIQMQMGNVNSVGKLNLCNM